MRKIAIILITLACGWLCGTASSAPRDMAMVAVQTSFDSPVANQLRCEREYNSNLGAPLNIAAEPTRTLNVKPTPCPERLGVRCGVASGRNGLRIDALTEFTTHLFYAGAGTLDYHIYRLHRLRI